LSLSADGADFALASSGELCALLLASDDGRWMHLRLFALSRVKFTSDAHDFANCLR